MRLSALERVYQLYPALKKVAKDKAMCLPRSESISVLPDEAKVELQPVPDHTAAGLVQLQGRVLESLADTAPIHLTLYCKWGIVGSSGHSQCKHTTVRHDDQLFATTLVLLRLWTQRGVVVI